LSYSNFKKIKKLISKKRRHAFFEINYFFLNFLFKKSLLNNKYCRFFKRFFVIVFFIYIYIKDN
jgi:hypothetical protein